MGLAFRSPESSQVLLLGKWLKELRGEASREPHSLDQDETAHNRLDGKDELRLAFEALVVHLMSKEVLSEDEGDAILRRLLN